MSTKWSTLGVWEVGAGWTFEANVAAASPSPAWDYVFDNPTYIRVGGTTLFSKIVVALDGAHLLVGKRNTLPTVEVAIPPASTIKLLAYDPAGVGAFTLTDPTADTMTNNGYCVGDELGEVGPEKEVLRVIKFVCSGVWA